MKREFRIVTTQYEHQVEWELLEYHGEGFSSDAPEAYSDAEALKQEILGNAPPTAPITTGTVAPNQATPVVNQELTKEQRETLYRIVYDSHRYCYKGDDEPIADDPISEHDYMKLLAKLSE